MAGADVFCSADWLKPWASERRTKRKSDEARQRPIKNPSVADLFTLGPIPDYLRAMPLTSGGQRGVKGKLRAARVGEWQGGGLARLMGALKALSPDDHGYHRWVETGMALKEANWRDDNDNEVGLILWDAWSKTGTKYKGFADLEMHWNSFRNSSDLNVTLASIYYWAREQGWDPTAVNHNIVNGVASVNLTLPASITANPIIFPDLYASGARKPTCRNARVAIKAFELCCNYDTFHDRLYIGGQQFTNWSGEVSDHVVHALRIMIQARFNFDPTEAAARDAVVQECLEHSFNPVTDYLDGLRWDGVPRLRTWLARYMGADDTPLNSMIGALMLVAAVRRARQPGCKFDTMIVLEGPEGTGKSSAIEILAGRENFSDQEISTAPENRQQEAIVGVWLYEISELAGIRKADGEKVKTFLSRNTDRTRPAYGHFRVDRKRYTLFVGTTNEYEYLLSLLGNRRVWPIRTRRIDLKALQADRDQLWAEAAMIEARGVSLVLPEAFWSTAREIQEQRLVRDAWEDRLETMETNQKNLCLKMAAKNKENEPTLYEPYATLDGTGKEYRISSISVLDNILNIPVERQNQNVMRRLAQLMRRLGWEGPIKIRFGENTERGYRKIIP